LDVWALQRTKANDMYEKAGKSQKTSCPDAADKRDGIIRARNERNVMLLKTWTSKGYSGQKRIECTKERKNERKRHVIADLDIRTLQRTEEDGLYERDTSSQRKGWDSLKQWYLLRTQLAFHQLSCRNKPYSTVGYV
jgi:hypothetical protein